MKKIFLPILFLIFAPFTLFIGFFALWQIFPVTIPTRAFEEKVVMGTWPPLELYSALPPQVGTVSQEILPGEARPLIIRNYLEQYHSPMAPYADFIFQISEKWGLDYRLIVAISQCESNLCKKIPEGSFNCWGFENGETKFLSWKQAIEQVAKTLKEDYVDKGLVTPEEIMPKYAPPSVEKGGPWAKCVNQFLVELE